MKFCDWLGGNTVDDVMRSKTARHSEFISVSDRTKVWDVLHLLGKNDLFAVCVHLEGVEKDNVSWVLTMSDFLEFLRDYLKENFDAPGHDFERIKGEFLENTIAQVLTPAKKSACTPVYIKNDAKLVELVEQWTCDEMTLASQRVLVGSPGKVKGILTLTDFLHYCFVNAHLLSEVMQAHALAALFPGTKTPTPFSSSSLVQTDESMWSALNKVLDAGPAQVIGVIDSYNGNLVGYVSSVDFIPQTNREEIVGIIQALPQSVSSFKTSLTDAQTRLIDAVTFRDQMSIEQLMERLLKLKVHQLWRIIFTGQVVGIITAKDILCYFKRVYVLEKSAI